MFLFKLPVKLVLLVLGAIAGGVLWQQTQLGVLALSRVDPLPETRALIADERYADAAEYLDFFMDYDYVASDPAAQALHAEIAAKRASLSYQASKLSEGLLNGTSDETVGQVASVVSDFFVIGDVRDLTKQGINWARGEEVDEVIAALATIGVVATAAQLSTVAAGIAATAGTSGAAAAPAASAAVATTAAKGGLIVLKTARKLGKLPPWLGKAVIQSAKTVKKTKSLDGVTGLLGDSYRLAKTRGGLNLLAKTTDAASLGRMARVADTFGDRTAALYRIGGDHFIRTAQGVGSAGADAVKLSATYGKKGLQVLDRIGPTQFIKLTARGSKMAYKGDIIHLIARLFLAVPTWALYLTIALAAVAWMPWRVLQRLAHHIGRLRARPPRTVAQPSSLPRSTGDTNEQV